MGKKNSGDQQLEALRRDIHGETIAEVLQCDYCGSSVDAHGPVMYDVLKVEDMPNLETLVDVPQGWIPDALRCRDCEIEELQPATEGFKEALVMVGVNKSNGQISIDATSISAVEISDGTSGYYPPKNIPTSRKVVP